MQYFLPMLFDLLHLWRNVNVQIKNFSSINNVVGFMFLPCHYEILYDDGLGNLRCSINKCACVQLNVYIFKDGHILYRVI